MVAQLFYMGRRIHSKRAVPFLDDKEEAAAASGGGMAMYLDPDNTDDLLVRKKNGRTVKAFAAEGLEECWRAAPLYPGLYDVVADTLTESGPNFVGDTWLLEDRSQKTEIVLDLLAMHARLAVLCPVNCNNADVVEASRATLKEHVIHIAELRHDYVTVRQRLWPMPAWMLTQFLLVNLLPRYPDLFSSATDRISQHFAKEGEERADENSMTALLGRTATDADMASVCNRVDHVAADVKSLGDVMIPCNCFLGDCLWLRNGFELFLGTQRVLNADISIYMADHIKKLM